MPHKRITLCSLSLEVTRQLKYLWSTLVSLRATPTISLAALKSQISLAIQMI